MKNKHILLICVLSAAVFSCKNAEKNVRDGWAAFDGGRHEEAARQFDRAIRADGHDWNKGYAQKCQLLRAQYFFGEITKAQFFTSVRSVYDEWFEKNPNDEEHLVPYAVLLFFSGEEEKSISLMESVYNCNHNYDFENPSISDVHNFFAGVATGKIRKEDFSGTAYEFLFDAAEEDLISVFSNRQRFHSDRALFVQNRGKCNHGNMKIICPDNDFEKPVSNPIFHIEIYEHDVLLQTIEYSYQDTFMLEKHFDLLDVNFDGHDDIVILAGLTANRGQKYYDAYIWNPRQNKFILHDEIRNVINMKIDKERKLIYSSYMMNGGRTEYYAYSFFDDKLVEIDCMIQQENDGNKRFSKSDFSDASLEYEELPSFWKSVVNLYD